MSHVVDSVSFGAIVVIRDRLLDQQAAGHKIFRFESGDPSFDAPPHVREAIKAALDKGLTHYTASTGVQPLRDAILAKVRRDNGLPIENADQVVVTNGGMHALYVTFRALLEQGDEVILPDPMWTEIAENIRLAGGVPVRVQVDPQRGLHYSAAAIAPHITPRTRAIFVNTPHNPTGIVLGLPELTAIADLAAERGLFVVSDEAYEHVIFDGARHISIGSLPQVADKTISLFSMSKSYALSGLRVGYMVTRDPTILERAKKLARCTINGVNSITQYGAAAALSGSQEAPRAMGLEYQARRDTLLAGLAGVRALRPLTPQGSFFLWLAIDPSWEGYKGARDDWAMARFLIDEGGVGCIPGTAFGPAGEGHVRLAFSCDSAQVAAGAEVIRRLLG